MKRQKTLVIVSIFAVTSLFIASNVLANEKGQTRDTVSNAQCSGQIDRDLSYGNPDYSFN